jgi:hypothetical protein
MFISLISYCLLPTFSIRPDNYVKTLSFRWRSFEHDAAICVRTSTLLAKRATKHADVVWYKTE